MKSLPVTVVLFLTLLVSACVSETTGGFDKANPEELLQNYLQLASGYLEQNDLSAARRHLGNAAGIDANNSEMFGIWGLVYSLEGDEDLADQSFRRALRIDSENSQVRNNYAAFLFSNNRYQDAYDQLAVVVQDTEYSGRTQAFENMGLAALQLERLDDAEYAFGRALQLNSNRIRATLELADIFIRKDNFSQADRYYQSFQTLRQFYNIPQSARSLWVGVKLENFRGGEERMYEYGSALGQLYPNSLEYEQYRELLND